MSDHDQLDRLLDSALSTYASPEPDFKERLLRSIASTATSQRRLRRAWLPWAIALPVAACLLVAIFLHVARPRTAPVQQARSVPSLPFAVQPEPRVTSVPPATSRRRHKDSAPHPSAASTIAMPKQDVFPTPQPLTAEERALVTAAGRGDPSERQRLLTASKPPPDAPLAIAGLSIPPLATFDEGNN